MRRLTESFKNEFIVMVSIVLAFTLLFVFITSVRLVMALTWEGELDPNEFTKWNIGMAKRISPMMMIAIAQNPDRGAEVQRIQMFIHIDGTLLSYRYFKRGEIYEYETNVDMNRYERRSYTKEERYSCMQCHSEISEIKESI